MESSKSSRGQKADGTYSLVALRYKLEPRKKWEESDDDDKLYVTSDTELTTHSKHVAL